MSKIKAFSLGVLALGLGLVSSPGPATSTRDWTPAETSAAKVRALQTKLMVAALRCRATGIDILATYNRFVGVRRAELRAANDRLKAHFAAAGSAIGQRDYDRYTTALANSFGGTSWGPESCQQAVGLAIDATEAKGNLTAVAETQSDLAGDGSIQPSSPNARDQLSTRAYTDRGPFPERFYQNSPPGYGSDQPSPRTYYGQTLSPR